ncbi:MAG: SRPBCC domain-containing protein [Pseudomonadales bacterium]|nr:SRPBCC domain-containing protein [Pseudomonadales bacterium]
MLDIQTTIDIQASPHRIWAMLIDIGHYRDWNPFITAATGTVKPGQKLDITLAPAPQKRSRFKPTVMHLKTGQALAWRHRLPIPGLFTREQGFVLSELEDGNIRLSHSQTFRGLWAWLCRRSLHEEMTAGMKAMNQTLKERAESRNAGSR